MNLSHPLSFDDKHNIMSMSLSSSDFDIKPRRARSQIDVTPRCYKSFSRVFLTVNLAMLVAGLIFMGTGASLMGFYRLHMLEVISFEFVFVPVCMIAGGAATLLISIFGFYADIRHNSCFLVTYAVSLGLELIILIAAVGTAAHLTFVIQTGIFDGDVIPELNLYQIDPFVRYKWDTLQHEFSCCGAYGYTLGYTAWKHTVIGGAHNAVPDSCCLVAAPGCGRNIFNISDVRVVIGKIHTHGCFTTMMRRLDTHVRIILLVFAIAGALVVIVELLMVVLSCCMASSGSNDDEDWETLSNRSIRSRTESIPRGRSVSRSGSMTRSRSGSLRRSYAGSEIYEDQLNFEEMQPNPQFQKCSNYMSPSL